MTSLPEQEKIGREALAVDHVLCDGQLQRLGVRRTDRFPGRQLLVRTNVCQARSERLVTFRALNPDLLRYPSAAALAHLAGTAEIRLQLGVSPQQWRASPRGGNHREPDARWATPGEETETLIEYDACGYRPAIIWKKLQAFRPQGPVVWGTSSSLRGDHIREIYPYLRVLYVPWWETPEERAHTRAGGDGGSRAARKALVLERKR